MKEPYSTHSTKELEEIIKRSLIAFAEHLAATRWYGKEREMVSYYALGFLLKECKPGSMLFDPAQIAIESRVEQHAGPTRKKQVCKDLCIWPMPGQNCWDKEYKSTNSPLLIMEWKDDTPKIHMPDLHWLEEYSATRPGFTGFCVSFDLHNQQVRSNVAMVRKGLSTMEWLKY